MSKLPARAGWQWLSAGLALFRAQPGVLSMLLFANLLISLVISAVPLVGPMLAMVLIPSLSMAMFQGCKEIDEGRRATLNVVMTGLRAPVVRTLCKLGLIYLGVAVVLTLLARSTVSEAFWVQIRTPIDPNSPPLLDSSDVMSLLGIFVLQSTALLLLCFAAPLACWQKMAPGKATFFSIFAVLGAWKPFLTMLSGWFGVFFAAMMLTTAVLGNLGAGRVVLFWVIMLFVLLLQCALYAAYRQIFGVPEAEPQARPTVSLEK